jgi:hypothetical protein
MLYYDPHGVESAEAQKRQDLAPVLKDKKFGLIALAESFLKKGCN